MLKKDLATALGISASMVTRLAQRGMPTDSVGAAKRWRETNLATARRKEYRMPSSPRAVRAQPASDPYDHYDPADEYAEDVACLALREVMLLGRIGARLLADGGSLAVVEKELRMALRMVPAHHRDRVALTGSDDEFRRIAGKETTWHAAVQGCCDLPVTVWEALIAPVLAEARAVDSELVAAGEVPPQDQRPAVSDTEAAEMGAFWYSIAAGELAVRPGN